jgi:hypothetical protein
MLVTSSHFGEDARRGTISEKGAVMSSNHSRMIRERRTVEAMIGIYCHGQHGTLFGLCEDCETLQEYARQRLQKCPFQEGKTTCAKCPVHCYKAGMRAQIRAVMRYAGPRMLYRHPIMALQHMLDGRRKEPFRASEASVARPDLVK